MTQNSKVLSMLGLAAKAGKVASGEFSTEKEVKSGNACLVIVAEDASDNTKKLFRNMCKYYEVPMEIFATKEELGQWIGKAYRASIGRNYFYGKNSVKLCILGRRRLR